MAGVDITYADGSTVTAEVRPVHLILAERQFGDRIASHRIEATLYAAWRALGSPEGGFDVWLATIHEFDEVTRIAADPTGGEPLADASPT